MAMSGTDLGNAIYSAIQGETTNPQQIWQKVGQAIVNYFKSNAEIDTTIGSAQVVIAATGAVMNVGTETTTGTIK